MIALNEVLTLFESTERHRCRRERNKMHLMKFPRSKVFDPEFERVKGALWYPYVGKTFGSRGRRVMIYAHNIPIKPDSYEAKMAEWRNPATWADAIEEYTYVQGWWTNAFRYFIKGAVGLQENYFGDVDDPVTDRVDEFVDEIAYLNFIQDLVKSESQIANATWEQVQTSQRINREYLRILDISHCICWGSPTYNYVRTIEGFRVLSEQTEGKRGFSSCLVDTGDGRQLHILRVFHPSMPQGFHPYSEDTHRIISRFLVRAHLPEG